MHDEVDPLLLLAALAVPVVYFAVVWRRWPKVAIASLILYVAGYLPLTVWGTYTVANHGGADWRREWRPMFLVVEYRALSGRTRTALTLAGALCWPCLVVDRLVWHRTTADDLVEVPDPPAGRTGAQREVTL